MVLEVELACSHHPSAEGTTRVFEPGWIVDSIPTPGLELVDEIDLGEVPHQLGEERPIDLVGEGVARNAGEALEEAILVVVLEGIEGLDDVVSAHGSLFLAAVMSPASIVSSPFLDARASAVRQR